MKDLQDKRIENELSLMQNSSIPSKFKKINKDEYNIEVTVPYKMIESELATNDIVFLIHVISNFPLNQPKVFCKTPVNKY
jgi:ubiquitin-protein ligase